MKEIRFTVNESNTWYSIKLDFELSNDSTQDVQALAYYIKQAQDHYKDGKAKKVEVFDEKGQLLATSSDILESLNIDYK